MSFTGFQLGLSDDLLEASRKVIESSAEYKKFFDATLKKFGVTSPDELSGEKKKEFFDYIDKNYNSDDESGKDGVKKEEVEITEKKAKFIRLQFKNKNDAGKAIKWLEKNLAGNNQGYTELDYDRGDDHIGFGGVDDADELMKKLEKARFKFKVDHREEVKEDNDPCWKGYKQVGMKKKDGKEVPNCVPMNEEELKEAGIDKSDVDYSHLEEEE